MRKHNKVGGLALRTINITMLIGNIIVSTLIIVSVLLLSSNYKKYTKTVENYEKLVDHATDIRIASDYLTEQVRYYVVRGSENYLENYLNEVSSLRREKAIEEIRVYYNGNFNGYYNLLYAVNRSKELMNNEYYAIRLRIEADGKDISEYNSQIRRVELIEEDKLLTSEEKINKAVNMMFDAEYNIFKDDIIIGVDEAVKEIKKDLSRQIENVSNTIFALIVIQQALVIALLIFLTITFIIIYIMLIKPLDNGANLITEGKDLQVEGVKEYKILSFNYNNLRQNDRNNHALLTYELEHDKLTGLFNRHGYDIKYHNMNLDTTVFILIDIDDFKQINDRYGHSIGDKVLRLVGDFMKDNFREDDCLCRIGGDEFAILLPNFSKEDLEVLKDKCRKLNSVVKAKRKELPKFTLSIGIAFGEESDDTDTLFKKADKALYFVKENGRDGFTIFGSDVVER